MNEMQVDLLVKGFPGRASICGLSWASMVLIRTQGLKILVDLGSYPSRRYLISALKEKDVEPSEIDMVLLTHLHHDHVAAIDAFPQALFVYSRIEWEYANLTDEYAVNKSSLMFLHAYRRRLIEKDGEEIIPGINAIYTPGHTPGCVSYIIDVKGEKWVIAGDAIKNRGELLSGNVEMTADSRVSYESIQKVKKIANRVLPGHDCWLKLEDNKVIPLEENIVTIKFPEGVTVNGQNPLVLHLD